jgi:hypothetical protein
VHSRFFIKFIHGMQMRGDAYHVPEIMPTYYARGNHAPITSLRESFMQPSLRY